MSIPEPVSHYILANLWYSCAYKCTLKSDGVDMATYKAPLRDMRFVMQDLLNYEKHYQSQAGSDW